MKVMRSDGTYIARCEDALWEETEEGIVLGLGGNAGRLILSEDDIDAINAIQDRGQQEADAGISEAHDAWERRRFLNETARELFRDLFSRYVDLRQPDTDREAWTEEAARRAAEAAGCLFFEVEKVASTYRGSGLDVD